MKYLIVYRQKLDSGIVITDTRECENTTELHWYLDKMEDSSGKFTAISITPIPD